jgi:uncharacterized Zn finger protein
MKIKELIESFGEKGRDRKEMIKQLDEQLRIEDLVKNMRKSANEREVERFMKEEREENIKEQLQTMRKERQNDIQFNHNPLSIPNITNHVDWEVLKERNLFAGNRNMFSSQDFIFKNNHKLLNNNIKLIR